MTRFEEKAKGAGMTVVPFMDLDLTGGKEVPSFSTDRLDQGLAILMNSGLSYGYTKDCAGWRFYFRGEP